MVPWVGKRLALKKKRARKSVTAKMARRMQKASRSKIVQSKRIRNVASKGVARVSVMNPSSVALFPKQLTRPLNYATYVYLDLTAGQQYSWKFLLNSCYDFDNSNNFGNKQPNGFDALCGGSIAPYTGYMVKRGSWAYKVTMLSDLHLIENTYSSLISGTGSMYYGDARAVCPLIIYETRPFGPTEDNYGNEQSEWNTLPGVKKKFLLKYGDTHKVTQTYNTMRLLKMNGANDDLNGITAAYNANPSNLVYGRINLKNDDSRSIRVLIELEWIPFVTFVNEDPNLIST